MHFPTCPPHSTIPMFSRPDATSVFIKQLTLAPNATCTDTNQVVFAKHVDLGDLVMSIGSLLRSYSVFTQQYSACQPVTLLPLLPLMQATYAHQCKTPLDFYFLHNTRKYMKSNCVIHKKVWPESKTYSINVQFNQLY